MGLGGNGNPFTGEACMDRDAKDDEKWAECQRRFRALWILIIVPAVIVVFRLGDMQCRRSAEYLAAGARNRVDTFSTPAPRGRIMDAMGHVMAYDTPSFSVIYARSDRPIDAVAKRLSRVLRVPRTQLTRLLKEDGTGSVHTLVASRVSARAVSYIREHQSELPGVRIVSDSIRNYPDADTACHILGYINAIPRHRIEQLVTKEHFPPSTRVGWAGVEGYYDNALRGKPGRIVMEVDSRNVPLHALPDCHDASKGADLVLTLSHTYERTVQNLLAAQVHYLKAHGHRGIDHAMAIAMNPQDGSILALASYPYYKPQWFSQGISYQTYQNGFAPAERNWVTQAPIAPGSTMKPLTALFAYNQHAITLKETIDCNGALKLPNTDGTTIRCWTRHDPLDMAHAIAESCDVYFYQASLRYGRWPPRGNERTSTWLKTDRPQTLRRLEQYSRGFGLGTGTGIDLPEEEIGYLNDSSLQLTDLPYTAIGQNEVYTPLELAVYTAALANGGYRVTPHVVKQVGGVNLRFKRYPIAGIDQVALREVQRGMWMACNDPLGTAYSTFHGAHRDVAYAPAGKTGTAETGVKGFDNAVFIGYAPYHHPRIAIAIVVPGGGHGADSTGPIARGMLDRFFPHKAPAISRNITGKR